MRCEFGASAVSRARASLSKISLARRYSIMIVSAYDNTMKFSVFISGKHYKSIRYVVVLFPTIPALFLQETMNYHHREKDDDASAFAQSSSHAMTMGGINRGCSVKSPWMCPRKTQALIFPGLCA